VKYDEEKTELKEARTHWGCRATDAVDDDDDDDDDVCTVSLSRTV
jgi:hypothetical protein